MVVCKYYQEGYCKFGSRCRFEHNDYSSFVGYEPSSPGGRSALNTGGSILKTSNSPLASRLEYGSGDHSQSINQSTSQQYYQQKTSKYSLHDIMNIFTKDISQAEKCNQWQLSCYSPVKDLPNFPGLEDYSPEELRWDCYKACKDSTIPLWQATLQQLYTNAAKINNELKKKTGYTLIEKWLREAEENTQSHNTSLFGASQMIPSAHTNMTVFGGASATVGSVFGGSGGNASGFGTTSSFASSPFGSGLSEKQNNPFFSQPNIPHQTGSFSFSTQQQASAPTYSGSEVSVFGGNQASPTTTQNYSQPYSASIGSSLPIDFNNYSKEEELVAKELEAFKAKDFSFGSIPTKPPPRSLCIM